jgi:translation initiation factor IF-2
MKNSRPPIVTVLGHVDHGKTSLLDAIRKTNVASREAGGITQAIGASLILTKNKKKITFIDTPGHAAFSKMRARGANVADIAVLVVAADDGVKPQTKEALEVIKAASIPFIVAITKIDLPGVTVESTLSQLEKENVLFEKRGGDVPFVPVSSKTGEGIDDLLDLISLLGEVNGISADPNAALEAVVVEISKDKKGVVASIVVRNGKLKVGQDLWIQNSKSKVKGIFNYRGEPVKEIFPGEPAQIIGFDVPPQVGTLIGSAPAVTPTKDKKTGVVAVNAGEFGIFLKAKNEGSLEAIEESLPKGIVIVAKGIGDLNESDVLFAKSASLEGIFLFESKVSSSVAKLAEAEGIKIYSYNIIYNLIEKLEEMVKKEEEIILGSANIINIFPFNNKRVAGAKMISGKITKSDKLTLMRGEVKLGVTRIVSLKKKKEDVVEVKAGDEFGIIFAPDLDFAIGDVLLSLRI